MEYVEATQAFALSESIITIYKIDGDTVNAKANQVQKMPRALCGRKSPNTPRSKVGDFAVFELRPHH